MVYLIQLKENTPNTPDITWLRPSQLQDNLWWPVVSGADHTTVVFPVKGGRPKVNQAHLKDFDETL